VFKIIKHPGFSLKNPGGLLTIEKDMLGSYFEFVLSHFYTLNHHHQVLPMDVQRRGILIKGRKFEAARVQLLMIDHHSGIFHVQDLHDVAPFVDENKNPAIAHILIHGRDNNAAESVKTLAHIYRHRVQKVLKRLVQMEHTLNRRG
jgi:hypothetical protein